MNNTRAAVAQLVTNDASLHRDYEAVFGPVSDSVDCTFANIGKAIAAYQRRLVSRNSPFDRYIAALRAGKSSDALSPSALRGLQLFVGRGNCRICHSGPNFTDGEFHNTGVPVNEPGDRTDGGRYEGIPLLQANPFHRQSQFSDSRNDASAELLRSVRRTPDTWAQFKTPSLRNVALTAPYMHHGQLETLRDVLAFYSTVAGSVDQGPNSEKILAPLHLSEQETNDLIAFLESLSDEAIDGALMQAPQASAPEPAVLGSAK